MSKTGMLRSLIAFIALALLSSGCERREFRKAVKEDSIEDYQKFLEKYPEGKYSKLAEDRIEYFNFQWTLNQKTIKAYQDFIKKYPNGDRAGEIKIHLTGLLRGWVKQLSIEELKRARLVVESSAGSFTIKLFPDQAPGHARNLIYLAASGFYDGIPLFKADADKLVLIGDFKGGARDGPGYTIPAEITDLKHVRGTVSMWHFGNNPDTAGSQFFICLDEMPELDGKFTVFGEVEAGLETVAEISRIVAAGLGNPGSLKPTAVTINQIRLEGLTPQRP